MTVLLLLWCCGGYCWDIWYCLYQSIIALFGVLKCGPHCHPSYFKCKNKRKPWPWWKRAHKMRRRRSLAYHRQWHRHFFQPTSKISNIVLHNWCYADRDFTQLPRLLQSFSNTQQLHEWKNQSTAQAVVNRLNVFQCSLENNKHCNHGGSFESTPLVWDTGASLGLTP